MNYKRVLVISNNCFSLSNSNGRTLGSLFSGWPKEKIAQFCIIAKDPDWNLCNNYYCLEDKAVLNAFLHCQKAKGRKLVETSSSGSNDTIKIQTGKKTVNKALARELVWSMNRWKSKHFTQWVQDFNPEVVMLQFGDTAFMLKIAQDIANKYNIPLTMFNTEGYYFLNRNFYYRSAIDALTYPIFRFLYKRSVCQFMKTLKYAVYCNHKLAEDYTAKFEIPNTVLYTGSDLTFQPKDLDSAHVKFSYLGNLGLDRDSGLIDIGKILQSINPNYYIDVYGSATPDVEKRLNKATGIRFHGLISYDSACKIISQSDILFHVETKKGLEERQLQYGFSTKIADSISSGKCFVLYAPAEIACSKYILETGAGWFAENSIQLTKQLKDIIFNHNGRKQVIEKARQIALLNHSTKTNAQKFHSIINNL